MIQPQYLKESKECSIQKRAKRRIYIMGLVSREVKWKQGPCSWRTSSNTTYMSGGHLTTFTTGTSVPIETRTRVGQGSRDGSPEHQSISGPLISRGSVLQGKSNKIGMDPNQHNEVRHARHQVVLQLDIQSDAYVRSPWDTKGSNPLKCASSLACMERISCLRMGNDQRPQAKVQQSNCAVQFIFVPP